MLEPQGIHQRGSTPLARMVNLHRVDIDHLSSEDAIAWLRASAFEAQRLDFKEVPGNLNKLAESACAFANAYGGLIVIGFKDPDKANGQITATNLPLDLSDKTLLQINNKLTDATRPNFQFETVRFPRSLESSEKQKFSLIRIPVSAIGPHELLPDHVFPIRRDRRNDRMSLTEIEAMLRRRDGEPVNRNRWREHPEPSLVQFGQLLVERCGSHIGIEILPTQNELADLEHTRSDDDFLLFVARLVHTEARLNFRPRENGIVFSESSDLSPAGMATSPFALELDGSGEILGRLRIGSRKAFHQDVEDLANLLSISFNFAARTYRRKNFGPIATVRIVVSHPNRADRLISVLPEIHDFATEIDLSVEFPEVFGRFVERIWRKAGSNPQPSAVASLLMDTWDSSFTSKQDIRPWYAQI